MCAFIGYKLCYSDSFICIHSFPPLAMRAPRKVLACIPWEFVGEMGSVEEKRQPAPFDWHLRANMPFCGWVCSESMSEFFI